MMTFETLLDQVVNRPERKLYWSLQDLLSAMERLALHYSDDPARNGPDMLLVALECRLAIRALKQSENSR